MKLISMTHTESRSSKIKGTVMYMSVVKCLLIFQRLKYLTNIERHYHDVYVYCSCCGVIKDAIEA